MRKQRDDLIKHRLPAVAALLDHVDFIDETSIKTNRTRQRGWSQRGARPVMDAPLGSWGTQTFIADLGPGSLIAPWVIKGAIVAEAFDAYVSQVLVPALEPGTVVFLDNLPTHRKAAAVKAMREAGCWFLFLPTYSCDLNPIEMAISKLKAHQRRVSARTLTDMFKALAEICDFFSPAECLNYFKAAEYVSD